MRNDSIEADSPPTYRRPVDLWQYLLWPALLLIVVANAIKLLHQPLQVDSGWSLYVGKQLLAGKRLYVDIVENNPPLICFFTEIPNWIGAVLHVNVKLIWFALSSFVVSASAALCIYLLSRLDLLAGWSRALTSLVIVVGCVVPFASVFGERDHFAFVALLPVICLAAIRIARMRIPLPALLLVSAWAGVFLALKPFFLVPWILCLLFTFWRIRWDVLRQPETYIIPAFSVLHLLLVVLATPEYFDVVRLAWRWYGGYDIPRRQIAAAMSIPLWGFALSVFYRPSKPFSSLIRLTSLMTLGWILSAILQHKGNDYQVIPSMVAVALLAYFIVLDLWNRDMWREISSVPVPVAGLTIFALVAGYTGFEERNLRIDYFNGSGVLLPILRSNRHSRVMFLSTSLIAFPVVNETDVEFGNAYPCLWTLPGLYAAATHGTPENAELPFHPLATMPAAEHDLFNRTYLDLSRKPKLIVVDAHRYKWAMRTAIFDFEAYFQRDERIRRLWAAYRELPPVQDFRIYELM